jgi:hypothetical protein
VITDAQVEAALEAFETTTIIGTKISETNYAYDPDGPFALVDTTHEEPEVNYPGELISNHKNYVLARRAWMRNILEKALEF